MRSFPYILLSLTLLPLLAHAQGTGFVPLTTLPGISEIASSDSLAVFLSNLYKLCIGAAAVLAVLQLMRAGVLYMGGDSVTEKKEARDLIAMSIIGLLLVLSPVIVFSIINPDILKLDLNVGMLHATTTPVVQNDPGAAAQATGDGSCTQSCNPGTTCKAGACIAVTPATACTHINTGTSVTSDQFACCTQQGYYVVAGYDSHGTITNVCQVRTQTIVKFTNGIRRAASLNNTVIPADQARYTAYKTACEAHTGFHVNESAASAGACSAQITAALDPIYRGDVECSTVTLACQ